MRTHLQSLFRSPLKTLITLLLLAAASFLFLYNLSEYSVSDREYREARDQYEGVLTVEAGLIPEESGVYDFFLMTDETGRSDVYGKVFLDHELTYDHFHQQSLDENTIEELSALPHVSRVEKRYLTAGVSPSLVRLDTDKQMFPYSARCIIAATVQSRYPTFMNGNEIAKRLKVSYEYFLLEDIEVLAGDPVWLQDMDLQAVHAEIYDEEKRDNLSPTAVIDITSNKRLIALTLDNRVFPEDAAMVEAGRRYVFVLRNNPSLQVIGGGEGYEAYPSGQAHLFALGDDSIIGWWPYFTDITDLPDNWLETEEFADLRELIRVTNDDVHTFDVVYGDDMAAQRRAVDGRLECEEGRFITPADAGQPVCVVNAELLETYGLKVGDTLTLNLGNYLSEQYAPLGAVAVTRGRQNTAYTEQTFTIIGSWRDLNEGNHVFRDRYWCWSNNAIFVPTAFLPECRNAEGHTFKPSEISFVVGNAEEITDFVRDCLPQVEAMGLTYQFSDGGWLRVGEKLSQSRKIAMMKLIIFSAAAVFALVLTVWLFIGRKKRDYGILRALGMPKGEASNRLYIPFLLLGLVSTVIGLIAARIAARQLAKEASHAPAGLGLFLLGALGFLVLLAVLAYLGLSLIRRRSILTLIQGKQK